MTGAFYRPLGQGRYDSDVLTRGPWDPDSQHAGPPTALLADTLARRAGAEAQLTRVTCDILAPVPIAELTVTTEIVRPGRRVQLLAGTLSGPDGPLIHAHAWALRRSELRTSVGVDPEPPPPPEEGVAAPFFDTGDAIGYHTAMDVRFLSGGFTEPGPARAWIRMGGTLVDGEEPTPLGRVLVAADCGNGVSSALDFERFLFVNTDLSVHLHRSPIGEWVLLDAVTVVEPTGIGQTHARLADERGPIGHSLQSLLVSSR